MSLKRPNFTQNKIWKEVFWWELKHKAERVEMQTMMQAIAQTAVEATKVERKIERTGEYIRTTQQIPRMNGPNIWLEGTRQV